MSIEISHFAAALVGAALYMLVTSFSVSNFFHCAALALLLILVATFIPELLRVQLRVLTLGGMMADDTPQSLQTARPKSLTVKFEEASPESEFVPIQDKSALEEKEDSSATLRRRNATAVATAADGNSKEVG
jgi:hypothetical protein